MDKPTESFFTDLENKIGLEFAGGDLGDIISSLLVYIFLIAGVLLLLYLLYGGYRFMFSQGDPKSLSHAKGVITTALIGFIIVFVAFWIVQVAALILGLQPIIDVF